MFKFKHLKLNGFYLSHFYRYVLKITFISSHFTWILQHSFATWHTLVFSWGNANVVYSVIIHKNAFRIFGFTVGGLFDCYKQLKWPNISKRRKHIKWNFIIYCCVKKNTDISRHRLMDNASQKNRRKLEQNNRRDRAHAYAQTILCLSSLVLQFYLAVWYGGINKSSEYSISNWRKMISQNVNWTTGQPKTLLKDNGQSHMSMT